MLTVVAFVVVHESVTAPPGGTVVGFAVNVIVVGFSTVIITFGE
jgi:hypothetical protein